MLMRHNKAEIAVHGCLICPGDIFRACARGLLHLDVGVCEGLFFSRMDEKKVFESDRCAFWFSNRDASPIG